MPQDETFSFENLFAESSPGPVKRQAAHVGKYDFAIAYPDPHSLPLDDLVGALREAFSEGGEDLALYPHPQGYPPLRQFIADRLAEERGFRVDADDIYLGDGSGQPLQLLTEVLVDPGDAVFTESFVYHASLTMLRRYRADIRAVECDGGGMLPDALEASIKAVVAEGKTPKLIYTIPTFQNPLGWTMPLERRQAMLRLSERYGVPILEDDCYVDLRYEGDDVPAIRSLDDSGRVMYVASFSKIIAPGMRLGYVTAPPAVLDKIRAIKSGSGVNEFAAMATHRYAVRHLDRHVDDINEIFRARRDAMLAALGENFGSSATWSRPEGGLYVWVEFPEGTDVTRAKETALEAGVTYHDGVVYSPDGVSGANCMRLCFGYNTPEEIHEGVALLADAFERQGVVGR